MGSLDCHDTSYVTILLRTACCKRPFGVCKALWLFTEMEHVSLGHIPELLSYMDGLAVLFSTGKNHLRSIKSTFVALQSAALTQAVENLVRAEID